LRKKKNKAWSYVWYAIVLVAMLSIIVFLPSEDWLYTNVKLAFGILLSTVVASFIGYVIEERNWSQFMKRLSKPLTHWANLPLVSATALFSSFFSLVTANSMLTAAYQNNELSRLQLRVSAMCTSFMSYLYHSLRIMYPTIAAVGMVGAVYFGLLFGLGFMVVFMALLVSKYNKVGQKELSTKEQSENEKLKPEAWIISLKKARKKTLLLLKRMLLVAIPMFLFFSFLSEKGFFDVSEEFLKSTGLGAFFPAQSIAVASAMMGGIISAATVAAGFMKSGELQATHVLLALLAGNIISLPIRSLRRSLPSAMSVFPGKEALIIVLLNQGSRFISYILLLIGIILLVAYSVL